MAGAVTLKIELPKIPDIELVALEGLDEIGITLKHEAQIAAFQARDLAQRPWIYQHTYLLPE